MEIATQEEVFDFQGKTIKVLVVKDIEKLCTEPENEDKIPYWADIWPAARVMAQDIWEDIDFTGKEVMELGAGLGLPGIMAGLKGGKVTFSDYKEEALELALKNAKRNSLKDALTYLGDWRHFNLDKKFDCILGSDILYNPGIAPDAEKVLVENIKENGQLIISHACRPTAFQAIERLKAAGPFTETIKERTVTLEKPYYPNYKIILHYLNKEPS